MVLSLCLGLSFGFNLSLGLTFQNLNEGFHTLMICECIGKALGLRPNLKFDIALGGKVWRPRPLEDSDNFKTAWFWCLCLR